MNETTLRVIERMKSHLRDYKLGNHSLLTLVNNLEGGFNSIEENLSGEFKVKWFVHWGGLEQILASETEEVRRREIMEDVEALELLLSEGENSKT